MGWDFSDKRTKTDWNQVDSNTNLKIGHPPTQLPLRCSPGDNCYPEAKGEYLHDALEGEEAGEGGVHVVQQGFVSVILLVILNPAKYWLTQSHWYQFSFQSSKMFKITENLSLHFKRDGSKNDQ